MHILLCWYTHYIHHIVKHSSKVAVCLVVLAIQSPLTQGAQEGLRLAKEQRTRGWNGQCFLLGPLQGLDSPGSVRSEQ